MLSVVIIHTMRTLIVPACPVSDKAAFFSHSQPSPSRTRSVPSSLLPTA